MFFVVRIVIRVDFHVNGNRVCIPPLRTFTGTLRRSRTQEQERENRRQETEEGENNSLPTTGATRQEALRDEDILVAPLLSRWGLS
jgi:hypothetical protein